MGGSVIYRENKQGIALKNYLVVNFEVFDPQKEYELLLENSVEVAPLHTFSITFSNILFRHILSLHAADMWLVNHAICRVKKTPEEQLQLFFNAQNSKKIKFFMFASRRVSFT